MVCGTVTGRKVRRIPPPRRRVDSSSKPEPGSGAKLLLTAQWNRCKEGKPLRDDAKVQKFFCFSNFLSLSGFGSTFTTESGQRQKLTGTETSTRSSPLTIIVGKTWA